MKPKIMAFLLMLFLLTSCSSGVTANRFFTLGFYEEEVIPSTTYLEYGEVAAVEFYAAYDFSGIEILAAKVSDDDTLTVAVYEFDTDYETTLKNGKKIKSATFRNYSNRDTLLMSFKTVTKGRYLLTFSTKSNAGICLAAYPSELAKDEVCFYLNGVEFTDGAFYAGVVFNGDRLDKNYFKEEIVVTPETPAEPTDTEPEAPVESETPVTDPENGEVTTELPDETE